MISIKEAVQQAADFCQQLFPKAQDIILEEVERDDYEKFWLITLSFLTPAAKQGGIELPDQEEQYNLPPMRYSFTRKERQYKILKVDAETGEVISMKIRELQS